MQIYHVIAWSVLLVGSLACVVGAWFLRDRGRSAVSLALAGAFLLAGIGIGARAWATARTVPAGFVYDHAQWSLEQDLSSVDTTCISTRALQRSTDWPLRRVGYITWINSNLQGSVGQFPRGLPLYTSPETTQVFVAVRPGCYAAYEAV